LTIIGNGESVRDYIYIENLCEKICQSFSKETKYDVYNLSSGVGVSVKELISVLSEKLEMNPEVEFCAQPETFVRTNVLDMTRFNAEFGGNSMTLREGIDQMLEKACVKVKK
jgi:UDP-glucose 4-epimerase